MPLILKRLRGTRPSYDTVITYENKIQYKAYRVHGTVFL